MRITQAVGEIDSTSKAILKRLLLIRSRHVDSIHWIVSIGYLSVEYWLLFPIASYWQISIGYAI